MKAQYQQAEFPHHTGYYYVEAKGRFWLSTSRGVVRKFKSDTAARRAASNVCGTATWFEGWPTVTLGRA